MPLIVTIYLFFNLNIIHIEIHALISGTADQELKQIIGRQNPILGRKVYFRYKKKKQIWHQRTL